MRSALVSGLVLFLWSLGAVEGREQVEFSFSWRQFEGNPSSPSSCPASAFPMNESGVECLGLTAAPGAGDAASCREACCGMGDCLVWQFADSIPAPHGGCWIGNPSSCDKPSSSWVGGGRKSTPSLPPPAMQNFSDATWNLVNAPHDFLISGHFSSSHSEGNGYLPRNTSWYRKHFSLPTDWQGKSVWVQFDGVFHKSSAWLNDQHVGIHDNGYTSFAWRLDNVSSVTFGQESVLALFVDATQTSSWWYAGGGLYRRVRLVATNRLHVAFDGLYVPANITGAITPNGATPAAGFSASSAVVMASAELALDEGAATQASVKFSIFDDHTSSLLASATTPPTTVSTVTTASAAVHIPVTHVQLWAPSRPYTYTVVAEVMQGGTVVDSYNTSLGFRSLEYSIDHGFTLNGEHGQHRGFCDHNNFGGVGMALSDRIHLFQAQSIRSIGGNARRTSHNAPDPQTMAVEDALGVMVLDENRNFLDSNDSFQAWHDLVKRDRNRPSNVFWSECNEAGCYFPGDSIPSVAAEYKRIARSLDPFRSITQNGFPGKLDAAEPYLDLQGLSHRNPSDYLSVHKQFPNIALVGSECCSCENTRGEDTASNGEPYNNNPADCIAQQTNWVLNASETGLNLVGTYTWTAFDYYGEGHSWPQKSCSYGQFDLSGFPKAAAYFYRAWWLLARPSSDVVRAPVLAGPEVHIVDSWDSGGSSSRSIAVYGGGVASIELLANGVSQGNVSIGEYGYATFSSVPFSPGTLQALGYDSDGRNVASSQVHTTTAATSISLSLDAPALHTGTGSKLMADGFDTALVRATLLDANGHTSHNASNNVTFTVLSGPGVVVGTDNGNPIDVNDVQVPWRNAFHGLARCIVRSTQDASSPIQHRRRMLQIDTDRNVHILLDQQQAATEIVLQASSPGLKPATIAIPLSTNPEIDGIIPVARANAINVTLALQ